MVRAFSRPCVTLLLSGDIRLEPRTDYPDSKDRVPPGDTKVTFLTLEERLDWNGWIPTAFYHTHFQLELRGVLCHLLAAFQSVSKVC